MTELSDENKQLRLASGMKSSLVIIEPGYSSLIVSQDQKSTTEKQLRFSNEIEF